MGGKESVWSCAHPALVQSLPDPCILPVFCTVTGFSPCPHKSQSGRGSRDLCGSPSPALLPKQGHLQQAAQDLVQAGLEYLQRRRLHNLPALFCRGISPMQWYGCCYFVIKSVSAVYCWEVNKGWKVEWLAQECAGRGDFRYQAWSTVEDGAGRHRLCLGTGQTVVRWGGMGVCPLKWLVWSYEEGSLRQFHVLN